MKKVIKYIFLLILISSIFSCEEPPLDRNIRPASEIGGIIVEIDTPVAVNPEDDSGLPGAVGVFVGEEVNLSSKTSTAEVASRRWLIPQPLPSGNNSSPTNITTFDQVHHVIVYQ